MEGTLHQFDTRKDKPGLYLCNNDDPAYWQLFETWEEVDQFIWQMRISALKGLGPRETPPLSNPKGAN